MAKRQGNYRRGRRVESLDEKQLGRLFIVNTNKIYYDSQGRAKDRIALVRCDCDGKEKEIRVSTIKNDLKKGWTPSCGCVWREIKEERRQGRPPRQKAMPGRKPGGVPGHRKPSLAGRVYPETSWFVLRDDRTDDVIYPPKPPKKYAMRVRRVLAQCLLCECEFVVAWQSLIVHKSKCCVKCAMNEAGAKRRKPYHDLIYSPTYRSWSAMIQRCTNQKNPAYSYYGGRGIRVCERWLEFGNFHHDMKERPEGRTLDRIDCDGDYEPGNCRWATWAEQALNRRRWARKTGVMYMGVYPCNKGGFIAMIGAENNYLGWFATAKPAAIVRDEAAFKRWGPDYKHFNFPAIVGQRIHD